MKHDNFKFPEPKVGSSNSLFYSTTSPKLKDIYDHIWLKKSKFSHLRSCSQRIFGLMCVIYQFPKYCLVTNQLMVEEIWRYLWVWMYVYDLCTWVFPCFLVTFGTWFVFFRSCAYHSSFNINLHFRKGNGNTVNSTRGKLIHRPSMRRLVESHSLTLSLGCMNRRWKDLCRQRLY